MGQAKKSSARKMSRRDLIQAASVALAAAGLGPLAKGNSKTGKSATVVPLVEPGDTFWLLYLWLVVSTNKDFGIGGNQYDLAEINTYSHRNDADALMKQHDWAPAISLYNKLAKDYHNYDPGQCPLKLTSLRGVSQVPVP
jgi:hypothetical protein